MNEIDKKRTIWSKLTKFVKIDFDFKMSKTSQILSKLI